MFSSFTTFHGSDFDIYFRFVKSTTQNKILQPTRCFLLMLIPLRHCKDPVLKNPVLPDRFRRGPFSTHLDDSPSVWETRSSLRRQTDSDPGSGKDGLFPSTPLSLKPKVGPNTTPLPWYCLNSY